MIEERTPDREISCLGVTRGRKNSSVNIRLLGNGLSISNPDSRAELPSVKGCWPPLLFHDENDTVPTFFSVALVTSAPRKWDIQDGQFDLPIFWHFPSNNPLEPGLPSTSLSRIKSHGASVAERGG